VKVSLPKYNESINKLISSVSDAWMMLINNYYLFLSLVM